STVVGRPVTWSSTNSSVVAVSVTGLATALAEGSATVVATVDGQSGRAPFVVTGTVVPVGTVTVTPESATISIGGLQQLHAEIRDANGQLATHRLVTWSSTNATVATVAGTEASAMVTGVAEGTTRIAATVEGKSDTVTITVSSTASRGPIAFRSTPGGCQGIYTMNVDGSNVVKLFQNANCVKVVARPAWSPDGTKIAFESVPPTGSHYNWAIYVMNADGSGVTVLPGPGYSPAWSPDGTMIAGAYGTGGGYSIFVMRADGSGRVVLHESLYGIGEPAWSPDGTKIAFNGVTGSTSVGGNNEVFVMNADGTGLTNLTNSPSSDWGPAWSPDGAKIAFLSSRAGSLDVYVMNSDGTGVTQLTRDAWVSDRPAWSPDGTKIIFDTGEIYVMNADGSGITRLTNNAWYDGQPAWRR
ncbi:MAG TPA: Ig-like domain-containing protein, partial [Gemmatimonadales bacterium]|nr:Ig-like domain-containing protein [Gemmatimonadales bacterium]